MTLGKFAPLHRGHQLVIETALAETDHVMVVIYDCPEVTLCPLPVRANWIKQLYPSVEVFEAWNGPMEVGDTPEIKARHEAYILALLKDRRITHFYSSEFYGNHVSQALGAVNRSVDPERKICPLSGTQIRRDPYTWRHFLAPCVYRDLIANLVFLGAPSTGKTTLAEHAAKEYRTVWMPEYGRQYWDQHQIGRRLSLEQLVEIARDHLAREEELLYQANKFLFTDTNALTTRIFSLYYHGKAASELERMCQATGSRYDLVFLCETDIPYEETWDRSGEVNRQDFQKMIKADLVSRKIPFFPLRGKVEERMEQLRTVLNRFEKYAPMVPAYPWQPPGAVKL